MRLFLAIGAAVAALAIAAVVLLPGAPLRLDEWGLSGKLRPCSDAEVKAVMTVVRSTEAYNHRLFAEPVVTYPRDLNKTHYIPPARLIVDPRGRIVCKAPDFEGYGPREPGALDGVGRLRFRPFVRDGKAVSVLLDQSVYAEMPVAKAVPLPKGSRDSVRIRFRRDGRCFGVCAAYIVEISGNGDVDYEGLGGIVIGGKYHYHIPQAAVDALLTDVDRAQFWSLDEEYVGGFSSEPPPTYELQVSIGGQTRTVREQNGPGANMPYAVRKLEDDIDRLSGAGPLAFGGEDMLPWIDLAKVHVHDLGSETVFGLAYDGSAKLFKGLMARGLPPEEVLAQSLQRGRYDLFSLALASARKPTPEEACAMQPAAAVSADYVFFDKVVALSGGVCRKATILAEMTDLNNSHDLDEQGQVCTPSRSWCYRAEPVKILRYLIANKANMYARLKPDVYESGDPDAYVIDYVNDEASLRVYLEAGYDLNLCDERGDTPLTKRSDEKMALVMLQAGADPFIRNKAGEDFFRRARDLKMDKAAAYITAHYPDKAAAESR
jgi:hypothetical protein